MKKKIFIFLFIVVIIIIFFILYGIYINPDELTINEYNIKSEKITYNFDGFKIVHFSDLLLDDSSSSLDRLKTVVNKINSLNADAVFFTGDLINKDTKFNDEEIKNIKELLNSIKCSQYKYAVFGDNDLKQENLYREIMSESNFILLDDSSSYLFYKDDNPIEIIGVTNVSNLSIINNTDTEINPSLKIYLTHYPDNAEEISAYNSDIILAGHSLGGKINLPILGGIIKKDNAKNYVSGVYNVHDSYLNVSNGIGTDGIKFRAFNTPSINLYYLIKETNN